MILIDAVVTADTAARIVEGVSKPFDELATLVMDGWRCAAEADQ
ncbi:hypothetical protein [Burkholderia metallica]|nr:hypothetical protein [Burkholderia metallica]